MSCRYGMYDHLITSQYYCDITGDFCYYEVPNERKCKKEYGEYLEHATREVEDEQRNI